MEHDDTPASLPFNAYHTHLMYTKLPTSPLHVHKIHTHVEEQIVNKEWEYKNVVVKVDLKFNLK